MAKRSGQRNFKRAPIHFDDDTIRFLEPVPEGGLSGKGRIGVRPSVFGRIHG
jgi:hypothetical protein